MPEDRNQHAQVYFNGEVIAHFSSGGAAVQYGIELSMKYPTSEIKVLSKFIASRRLVLAEMTPRHGHVRAEYDNRIREALK